jgi:hypothetical protein
MAFSSFVLQSRVTLSTIALSEEQSGALSAVILIWRTVAWRADCPLTPATKQTEVVKANNKRDVIMAIVPFPNCFHGTGIRSRSEL